MGIPSFYRHLCRRFPHIISHTTGPPSDWLCLDFNCAMYFVLHGMPPYEGSVTGSAKWEAKLRKGICDYLEEIVAVAKPTAGVYVACDGVVCAAKRRQQRLRRFKGPWLTASEDSIRGVFKERWDQNALTPGTAFMARLGKDLVATGARLGLPVIVSTTEEPGEGEHKLMAHMRGLPDGLSCTIYGLDADLLLLAMLLVVEKGGSVHLLREEQEFEKRSGGGGWRTVDIRSLMGHLFERTSNSTTLASKTRDFVAGMSLLGNDFLPKSLTHTVRDDGIPGLIRALDKRIWSAGHNLVVDGSIQRKHLTAIIEAFASEEESAMAAACVSALKQRGRPIEDDAFAIWSAQPAQWATILRLYNSGLRPNWKAIYESWRGADDPDGSEYLKGLAWVFDYYSGKPVDLGWAYEPHLPPLWSRLKPNQEVAVAPPPLTYTTYLPAWIHLLAVLPTASANKLLKKTQLGLLKSHPLYWPTEFSLFDIGVSQIWQTEAVIPIIPEELLRGLKI